MQIKIYTIPIPGGEAMNEEMNKFLRSKQVLQVEQQVVINEHGNYWCFCIRYLDGEANKEGRKIDYREVLDEPTFKRFARMREIRKQLAAEDEVERIVVPDNLRLAFHKAARGKCYAPVVETYRKQLDYNLEQLRAQILIGHVEVGQYRRFTVYEPKERQICAPAFSEQVLHHALMNVCHEYFERYQIYDSYASRPGKGTYEALARAKGYTIQYKWYLKLDVRKFFDSLHHDVIKQQLTRIITDQRVLQIFNQIVDSYEVTSQRGVPIGNLSSQYLANHYLSALDHLIKEKWGGRAYVRYMDDMVLWDDDCEKLKYVFGKINNFIEQSLLCALKPRQLNKTSSGLPFLGYHLFPYRTRLLQQSKRRFIKKLQYAEKQLVSGIWNERTWQRHTMPLFAFATHADSRAFRHKIIGKSP
jgi:RNA-directed DNA polymerase